MINKSRNLKDSADTDLLDNSSELAVDDARKLWALTTKNKLDQLVV